MEEINFERKEISWQEFVDNYEKWNDYLQTNQTELIIKEGDGELVAMSKNRYFGVYEQHLPHVEIVTYDDIANKT